MASQARTRIWTVVPTIAGYMDIVGNRTKIPAIETPCLVVNTHPRPLPYPLVISLGNGNQIQ
jgi:folate-dependent phosphoribosylglycinamide formyltransferase PurN